jgi:hypothetical protein
MLRPIDDWDAAYLDEVEQMEEGLALDKKESTALRPDVIEKQVCAFANAGGGFLVFGIRDKKSSGGFDAGVEAVRGREPVKAWVEALIRKQHTPPIVGCVAKFIQHQQHHLADRGVLVLHIPLSEHRPHWIRDNEEKSYLRVGEHSAPMARQTFLDLANRLVVAEGIIEGLGLQGDPGGQGVRKGYNLRPMVSITSGPVCQFWAFELRVDPGVGAFSVQSTAFSSVIDDGRTVIINGKEPLLPRRPTRVFWTPIEFVFNDEGGNAGKDIEAILFTGSATPTKKAFPIRDLGR